MLRVWDSQNKNIAISTKTPHSDQATKSHAGRAINYAPRRPWMKQCYLWGKIEKVEEKSNCFSHPVHGSTNTHPHLNHREGMGTWERKRSLTLGIRNKKRERVKLN